MQYNVKWCWKTCKTCSIQEKPHRAECTILRGFAYISRSGGAESDSYIVRAGRLTPTMLQPHAPASLFIH